MTSHFSQIGASLGCTVYWVIQLLSLYYTCVHGAIEQSPTLPHTHTHTHTHTCAAVADSLLECLEIQNLTSFISYLNQSTYLELLNTTGETLTVFAPTNAAFAAMSDQLIGMNPNTLVGNHIVNATILSTQLRSMMRFETVAQTTLHSTAVVFHDTSFLHTNPHYLNYYHQSNLVRTRSVSRQ